MTKQTINSPPAPPATPGSQAGLSLTTCSTYGGLDSEGDELASSLVIDGEIVWVDLESVPCSVSGTTGDATTLVTLAAVGAWVALAVLIGAAVVVGAVAVGGVTSLGW